MTDPLGLTAPKEDEAVRIATTALANRLIFCTGCSWAGPASEARIHEDWLAVFSCPWCGDDTEEA